MQPHTTQSVNRHLFNLLLETKSSGSLSSETTPVVMGLVEENAVRYASGYMAMKLMKERMKKIQKVQHSMWSVCHTWQWKEKKLTYSYTREWVQTVDRGVRFHINDPMIFFF